MAFEAFDVDQWLFTRLLSDTSLMDLLAVDNRAPNYQQCVYMHVAPEKDPVTLQAVQFPYIVVRRSGDGTADETSIGGNRAVVKQLYTVTVWDSQSGAVSYARTRAIADRVDVLLNMQSVTVTAGAVWLNRSGSDIAMTPQSDGRVDCGILQTYVATITP